APLPYADVPRFDARSLIAHWARLHAGHEMPAPEHNEALAEGWAPRGWNRRCRAYRRPSRSTSAGAV
ncbi:hypothetical protein FGX01_02660, partial [Xylella fastidiosa subsp. multiplex]|nr:hypothetical protein [Xylella fastidiosa subsp. multiplex]